MNRGTAPRLLTVIAAVAAIVSAIGFVATLVLGAVLWDDFDAYGEVPIPGSAEVHLPAGEVIISFHTPIIGSSGGGGLPVPRMSVAIDPPAGVADPVLTEDIGGTTTVNGDARVRVWSARVAAEGTYRITTEGRVSAYVNPTLAFGQPNRRGHLPVIFAVVFGVALVDLVIARVWAARVRRRAVPLAGPSGYVVPTDQGIRVEALETLSRLRDSGALTEAEFAAEKKRILDGY